jgi:hypothetical protein
MKPNKLFALLTIFIFSASAMLMAFPSGVLAAYPSVPEFSVAYVDHSYNVPVTHWTTTDPYTGEQINHSSGGEHVDNRTIDVTIKNQPFTPYKDPSSNQTVYLYYNVRSKGHFEDWNTANSGHNQGGLQATTSTYTVVSFNIGYWNVPQGGQIDFQVQASLSYTANTYSGSCFTGSQTTPVGTSDWSAAQTLTIGNPTPSSSTPQPITTPNQPNPTFNPYLPTASPIPPQSPTATPTQPNILTGVFSGSNWEQTALIVMAVVIACFVIVVVALLRKIAVKKTLP